MSSSCLLCIVVLCYDEASEQFARTKYNKEYTSQTEIVRLPSEGWLMENHFLLHNVCVGENERNEYKYNKYKYMGMISWRAKQKLSCLPSLQFIQEVMLTSSSAPDVLYFQHAPWYPRLSTVEASSRFHPHFKPLWIALLQELGYSEDVALDKRIPFFMYNYWIATSSWIQQYSEFLQRAVAVLQSWSSDPSHPLYAKLFSDSEYKGQLSVDVKQRLFQRPYYTYHPFLLERLPGFFFWSKNADIVALSDPPRIVHRFVPEFHPHQYLQWNPDLRAKVKPHFAAHHFFYHGYREGRKFR